MRFILALLTAHTIVCAQTTTETGALRLQGGILLNQHSGNPATAAPVIDCGDFSSGSGFGPTFSVGFELPFSSALGLAFDVGYSDRSALFSRQNTYPLRDGSTGLETTLTTDVQLDATLHYLEFQPSLVLPIIGTFRNRTLGIGIGPRVALPLAKSYTQTETVLSPDNGVIIENGNAVQQRTIGSGELLSPSSALLGASASLESFIPVSEKVSIVPRISADYYFTQIVTDADWSIFSIRAEVGVRFSFVRTQKVIDPPPPAPIVVPPPIAYAQPKLDVSVAGFDGEVVTGNELRAWTPVVTAVFFDSASSAVPLSYRRSNDGSVMSTDPVKAHDWILVRAANVIAQNPSARIVLEGATSGPTEPEGTPLAQRRAEAVRKVLLDLGVPGSKIDIRSSVLPRIPSNNEFAGGREENRRVDIVVQNAPLQRWVSAEEFATVQGSLALRTVYSGGSPDSRPTTITVNVNGKDTTVSLQSAASTIRVNVPIGLTDTARVLTLRTSAGGAVNERDTMIDVRTLKRRSTTLQTNTFNAVLRFDYNSSDLTENVQTLVTQLAELLPDGSTVVIEGSADVLGSEGRNRVLSEERAAKTERFIRSTSSKNFTFKTSTRSDRFSDETPQGRFLNRCIYVRVVTP